MRNQAGFRIACPVSLDVVEGAAGSMPSRIRDGRRTTVVDAVRRSIQTLAETGLVARAVKAGETAPLFRLRCGPGGFVNLSDLIDRGPFVVSFLWGDWCPFCVLELKALAAAHPEIERLGATLVALSPRARGESSSSGGELPFPLLQDAGCEIAARYGIAFTIPQQFRLAYLGLGYPHTAKDRIERLDIADTRHLPPR